MYQTKHKKTLAEFKSGGGASQQIMSSQTLHVCLSESVPVLSLEVLEQSRKFASHMSSQIYEKYTW